MNGLIALGGIIFLLLAPGGLIGIADRNRFNVRWLLIAALLVAVNDFFLTRGYGLLPTFVHSEWNWQGKILALVATLAIAALPSFGWRRVGLTLRQRPGSLRAAGPVAALYCLLRSGPTGVRGQHRYARRSSVPVDVARLRRGALLSRYPVALA